MGSTLTVNPNLSTLSASEQNEQENLMSALAWLFIAHEQAGYSRALASIRKTHEQAGYSRALVNFLT